VHIPRTSVAAQRIAGRARSTATKSPESPEATSGENRADRGICLNQQSSDGAQRWTRIVGRRRRQFCGRCGHVVSPAPGASIEASRGTHRRQIRPRIPDDALRTLPHWRSLISSGPGSGLAGCRAGFDEQFCGAGRPGQERHAGAAISHAISLWRNGACPGALAGRFTARAWC
jgi:hypothetical protein